MAADSSCSDLLNSGMSRVKGGDGVCASSSGSYGCGCGHMRLLEVAIVASVVAEGSRSREAVELRGYDRKG